MLLRPAVHTDQIIQIVPFNRSQSTNSYRIKLNSRLSTLSSYTLNHELNQTVHRGMNFKFIY